jgi:hypothetical protein
MAAAPIKPEYGPTLGRLLSPRWRSTSRSLRIAAIVSSVLLLALAIVAVDRLLNRSFSHAGRVPFSFNYRGLHRVPPDPGGYVKVERRGADGRLKASFAVEPLRVPAYSGDPAGELPLYATDYVRARSRSIAHFVLRAEGFLRSEGTAKIAGPGGYDVFYTALIEGRKVYGRDELVLPERPGAREGVDIVMLSAPASSSHGTSPLEVATKSDVLARPLRTFTLG